jgi:hypothetical protein
VADSAKSARRVAREQAGRQAQALASRGRAGNTVSAVRRGRVPLLRPTWQVEGRWLSRSDMIHHVCD